MNQFFGIGRLGRDAETRYTADGTAVANFSLAIDVGFGGTKQTLWLDAAIFGKRAESALVGYLTKGKQVGVSGEIGTRQYEKRDGSAGFSVTLRVDKLDLLGGGADQQSPAAQRPAPNNQQAPQSFDDDIPF